ncbi:hypothetical protein ASPZODRAFT_58606 [Penicilliopsis zonata CBS 506.65]|uniref:NAD(P)-binding protein n=1 Tax=Penicilliopsis zonata CBS 506.65 TaxID=1073090 RepID=A0A1L9SSK4_9EURO|nr:hypothetical protein ASPZODRAFT_58606 [Penicilliopsis zonata CBS 506.65]OJJ50096.1 hypothetical protein ASPZODRAFT_58606 [Penicilliopsis zonata CBS 506.65]
MSKHFAIIAGVGGGTGRSIALKFAKAYPVVLLSRTPTSYEATVQEINATGGQAVGISADLTDVESTQSAFSQIKKLYPEGHLAAAIFNAAALVRQPFLELTPQAFQQGLTNSVTAGFNFSQATLPLLLQCAQVESSGTLSPTLIFTGATASLKGSPNFAAFAAGKFALRGMAQSLAREFGPQGVHVAHSIIDGIIDTPVTKGWGFNGAKLTPEAIADSYWYLHMQPRAAFTFELDLRPSSEKW